MRTKEEGTLSQLIEDNKVQKHSKVVYILYIDPSTRGPCERKTEWGVCEM